MFNDNEFLFGLYVSYKFDGAKELFFSVFNVNELYGLISSTSNVFPNLVVLIVLVLAYDFGCVCVCDENFLIVFFSIGILNLSWWVVDFFFGGFLIFFVSK